MSKRDYYEVLGIAKNATDDEIKKAYRKKAIEFHPDKNPGDKAAEEKFKEAAEAYEILSNKEKRQRYDQFGHAGVGGASSGFGGGGMTMEDIFATFGDIFGGHFSNFGGFGASSPRMNRGSDLRVKVKLTLKEIATGAEKKLKVKKYVTCKSCSGSGADGNNFSTCSQCRGTGTVTRVQSTIFGQMRSQSTCPSCNGEGKTITKRCPSCNGEGVMLNEEIIPIRIPAGVEEGMQLSMTGRGNAARRGGINGDLLVVIEEEPDSELIRDDNDLIYNLLLPFPTAVLGGTAEVPTIDGHAKVKIEPGTQAGKVLRLRGKGLPRVNSYGTGDLLVNVGVYVPEKLSKDEKKLMETLTASDNFKPDRAARDKLFGQFRRMFE
ncbi:MAG: molecular chaperone DnaJ [Bacteroidales bacterium]|jgi:molecular chaperone DnaJ|nr:molecular chaperone DnaJ [Bacteroidales bacterium]